MPEILRDHCYYWMLKKAEAAVARYRGRTLAAITCQRVYRGHVARSLSMMIRQNGKIKVKLHVAREMVPLTQEELFRKS